MHLELLIRPRCDEASSKKVNIEIALKSLYVDLFIFWS